MFATYYGRLDIFNILLEKGADVNVKDKDDWGLLHHALVGNSRLTLPRYQLEIAKMLIEKGLDINHVSNVEGAATLHYIAHDDMFQRLSIDSVKWIAENGGDVNIKGRKNGEGPRKKKITKNSLAKKQKRRKNGEG